jgi:hypothetical protein
MLMNSEAHGRHSIKIVKVTDASSLEAVVDHGHRKRHVGATRGVPNVEKGSEGVDEVDPLIT